MQEYSDPAGSYTIEFPDAWLPLAEEGSPHVNLASLTTGGQLRIEVHRFDQCPERMLPPEVALRSLVQADRYHRRTASDLPVATEKARGGSVACADYDCPEKLGDFGHVRLWARNRGCVQVRCVYRCRRADAGTDDDDLELIMSSLEIRDQTHLDARSFSRYYYSLLKRHRPRILNEPPDGLTLTLHDGQTILLEQLYNHYRQQPEQLDELIESHINLLDFCGDDVLDLACYELIRPLLFPKLTRATLGALPPHRLRFWSGLALGAIVQGSVFHYGVNTERLHQWGFDSLQDIWKDLMQSLYKLPAIQPRSQRGPTGKVRAIDYVDHPFSSSFLLYEDFYETTAENLGAKRFLVAVPQHNHLSCFRVDDARFVAGHASRLRWEFHRSIEPLSDTLYLVVGPQAPDARPFDLSHFCVKHA